MQSYLPHIILIVLFFLPQKLLSAPPEFIFDNETTRILHLSNKLDKKIQNLDLILNNKKATDYLQKIINKLFPEYKDLFQVRIYYSTEANAFALGNGSIYFSLGFLAKIENEAQLAAVLAHEGSHVILRHHLHQIRNAKDVISNLENYGMERSLEYLSTFSVNHEYEADELGLKHLTAAEYNPLEAINTLKILALEEKNRTTEEPRLVQTHPKMEKRIEKLTSLNKVKHGHTNRDKYHNHLPLFRKKTHELLLLKYQHNNVLQEIESIEGKTTLSYELWYQRGEAYRQRKNPGDEKNAKSAYLSALKINPSHSPSYLALGIAYLKSKNFTDGLKMLEKYFLITPNDKVNPYAKHYYTQIKIAIGEK